MYRESIRPQELEAENLRLHQEDLQWFSGWKKEFVPVPCPGCGLEAHIHAFTKDYFDHMRCPHCKTLYISPRPTRERLMEFYKMAKSIRHWNERLFPETEEYRSDHIFTPRALNVVQSARNFGVEPKVLVDVGAGFGTFCKAVDAIGVFEDVIALEPSAELRSTLQKRRIPTIEAPVEEAFLHNVSVFTCFELLEHLYDPREALAKMHNGLVDRGILMLTTPNIEGFDLAVLGKDSVNVGGPNHLQLFSRLGITHLLHDTGFEILFITTPGKMDVENVRRAVKEGAVQVGPFLEHLLIEKEESARTAFQRFLRQNQLSSHMEVVARKVK